MTLIIAVVFDVLILLYFGSKVEILDIVLDHFTRHTTRRTVRSRKNAKDGKHDLRAA